MKVVAIAALCIGFGAGYMTHIQMNKNQPNFHDITNKINEMKLSQSNKGQYLFFGDSITQGLNDAGVTADHVNLGIGGDTVADVFERVKSTEIANYSGVFIEAGSNDFLHGATGQSVGDSVAEMVSYASSKAKMVFVSHVLMPNMDVNKSVKGDVASANSAIDIACSAAANCMVVPTPEGMIGKNGVGKAFSIEDGIHLNAQGYRLWKTEINKIVK